MAANLNTLISIEEKTGQEYMLRQLAEECAELCQAALKLIRAWNGETPVMSVEARYHLTEELADVMIMTEWAYWCLLSSNEIEQCDAIVAKKLERMTKRILGGGDHDGRRA